MENTSNTNNELDQYGVWVKTPPRDAFDETLEPQIESELPDFSFLDTVAATDKLNGTLVQENEQETPKEPEFAPRSVPVEDVTAEPEETSVSIEEVVANAAQAQSEPEKETVDFSSLPDGEISLDDFFDSPSEEATGGAVAQDGTSEVSLSDFFGDGASSGDTTFAPDGEISLDAFLDSSEFQVEQPEGPKEADEEPLDIDLTFDESPNDLIDNTADDSIEFDESLFSDTGSSDGESVDLSDFLNDTPSSAPADNFDELFNNIEDSSVPSAPNAPSTPPPSGGASAASSGSEESIDLSEFGIAADSDNQNVILDTDAKPKIERQDYNLTVSEEGLDASPDSVSQDSEDDDIPLNMDTSSQNRSAIGQNSDNPYSAPDDSFDIDSLLNSIEDENGNSVSFAESAPSEPVTEASSPADFGNAAPAPVPEEAPILEESSAHAEEGNRTLSLDQEPPAFETSAEEPAPVPVAEESQLLAQDEQNAAPIPEEAPLPAEPEAVERSLPAAEEMPREEPAPAPETPTENAYNIEENELSLAESAAPEAFEEPSVEEDATATDVQEPHFDDITLPAEDVFEEPVVDEVSEAELLQNPPEEETAFQEAPAEPEEPTAVFEEPRLAPEAPTEEAAPAEEDASVDLTEFMGEDGFSDPSVAEGNRSLTPEELAAEQNAPNEQAETGDFSEISAKDIAENEKVVHNRDSETAGEQPLTADLTEEGESMDNNTPNTHQESAGSTELLRQIASELASLRTEINGLKSDFETFKSAAPQSAAPEEKALPSLQQEEPVLETQAAAQDIAVPEPQAEPQESSGFFSDSEDEDDTIALSGDELGNILNSADFSATEEASPAQEEVAQETAGAEAPEPEPATEENSVERSAPLPAEPEAPVAEADVVEEESPVSLSQDVVAEPQDAAEPAAESVAQDIAVPEPQAEPQESSGFFSDSEDEDDTIALSGDELGNILNSADFSATEEASPTQEEAAQETAGAEASESATEETLLGSVESVADVPETEEFEAPDRSLQMDFTNETLEEPDLESVDLSAGDSENATVEDIPEEISVPKVDDILVESSSGEDFIESSVTEETDVEPIPDEASVEEITEESSEAEAPSSSETSLEDVLATVKEDQRFKEESIPVYSEQEDDDYSPLDEPLAPDVSDEEFVPPEIKEEAVQESASEEEPADFSEPAVHTEQSEQPAEPLTQENLDYLNSEIDPSEIAPQEEEDEELELGISEEPLERVFTAWDSGTEESELQEEDVSAEEISRETSAPAANDDLLQDESAQEETVVEEPEPAAETEPQSEEPAVAVEPPAEEPATQEESAPSFEEPAVAPQAELPANEAPAPTSRAIPEDMKQEIKAVLSYMDQLLESLPEDKIAEFAKSEQFSTYKKLFTELGLS